MIIEDFKTIKNRQRPEQCYQYRNIVGNKKYEISTFDSSKTFLATVETLGRDNSYFSQFSEHFDSVGECISAFQEQSSKGAGND